MRTITIVSPVPEAISTTAGSLAVERVAPRTRRVALLANGKPNAALLLDGVEQVLRRTPGFEVTLRESKATASLAAEPGVLDRMAATADLAVIASAD